MAKKVGRLAKRYARALLSSVQKGGASREQLAQITEALSSLSTAWDGDSGAKELRDCLMNPSFPKEERKKALTALAKHLAFPEIALRFLDTLFERDRLSLIPEVGAAFRELADATLGVVPVTVVTARQLSSDEAREIESTLKQKIGGEPQFAWTVDASILGGMIVEFQGKVLDGSLGGRISRLERTLLA